ncbi:MAG: YafY family transcriptional regulator [Reichenbachiella sp.]
MNRIDRLTAMMLKLQSKRNISALDLADHFDISERTVFRDIKALGEAGVPIGFEKDRGYFIVEGYYIPPIMFSKEEAGAILLAGKLLERQGDRSLVDQFDQALSKVRAVLKNTEKDYVHELEKHIEIVTYDNGLEAFPDKFLLDIKNAIVSKNVLTFEYYANYTDTFSKREVEPLGVCHYSNHWHLIGHCRKRNAIRDFRTDRIMKLSQQGENFDPTVRGNFKEHIFALNMRQEVEEVKVLFSNKVAQFVTDQKYYYGMIDELKTIDGVQMTFMVGELDYFARWLLMYTNSVTIIESDRLRNKMEELTNQLTQSYLPVHNS